MGQGWYGAIGKLAIAALLIGAVLIWRAEAWLHVDMPLEHADVIVVLGGESGQPKRRWKPRIPVPSCW